MKSAGRAAAALSLVLLAAACAPKKSKTAAEVLLTQRMAQVLLRDGHPVDAEKAFRDALKEEPKNPEVLDGLGVSLVMQGRYQEALPPLQKAVQAAPENGSYRNNMGVAQMELGQFAEAEQAFAAAERSANSDDRISAAINRGRLRQRQGDLAGAEREFTLAMARDPKSFAATFGRAVARETRGDLEGAAEDYLAALKLQSGNAEANLRLGLCLVSLEKPDLGRRYLQRAIDLDPNGDTGAKARMLLEKSK
ncbi:MAG: tetratricopeptide repeat protein [Thermoanaerobaculia bacterium]